MRRSFFEWLTLSAAGLCLGTVVVLAASFLPSWPASPIKVADDLKGRNVYLLIRSGKASLCNNIDFDSPDSPKASIIDPRSMIFPKVSSNHQFSIPGFSYQFLWLSTGTSIWSLQFTLAIPAVLWLIATAVLFRQLRQRRLPEGLDRRQAA